MPVIRILPHADYCPQGDEIEASRGTSLCEALLENGIYQTARAEPITRGGGPADYFAITEAQLFKMRRPA